MSPGVFVDAPGIPEFAPGSQSERGIDRKRRAKDSSGIERTKRPSSNLRIISSSVRKKPSPSPAREEYLHRFGSRQEIKRVDYSQSFLVLISLPWSWIVVLYLPARPMSAVQPAISLLNSQTILFSRLKFLFRRPLPFDI